MRVVDKDTYDTVSLGASDAYSNFQVRSGNQSVRSEC
jgi:hypothetical protein